MTRISVAIAVLVCSYCMAASAQDWSVGAASVVITPEKPMWMAGYASRTKPATGKLTELWAKALWLRDGSGKEAVLLALDIVGIDRPLGLAIRKRIAREHDLPLASVVIATSHTHSGPVVAGNLRPMHLDIVPEVEQERIRAYAKQLDDWCSEVVKRAKGAAAPATIQFGHGLATFAVNRRNNGEGAVPELRAKGRLVGPFDHDVPVLVVRNLEGDPKAIVFGYACHATVLDGYEWCGDYPGYAQIAIEKAFPGATALFVAGCGADQNPIPRRAPELASRYGAELARAVGDVVSSPMAIVSPRLATSYVETSLKLDRIPMQSELEKDVRADNPYVVARARHLADQLASDGRIAAEYPYPVARWILGEEVDWWFLGGEVVVDYSLRMRHDAAPSHRTKVWVTAYANDVMAYIPSRRVHQEGGYEGGGAMLYYGLPSPWAEDVEDRVFAAIKELRSK